MQLCSIAPQSVKEGTGIAGSLVVEQTLPTRETQRSAGLWFPNLVCHLAFHHTLGFKIVFKSPS